MRPADSPDAHHGNTERIKHIPRGGSWPATTPLRFPALVPALRASFSGPSAGRHLQAGCGARTMGTPLCEGVELTREHQQLSAETLSLPQQSTDDLRGLLPLRHLGDRHSA